jgi:hypothetical protein
VTEDGPGNLRPDARPRGRGSRAAIRRHRRVVIGLGIVVGAVVLVALVVALRYLPLLDDIRSLKRDVLVAAQRAEAAGLDVDRTALGQLSADLDLASGRLDRIGSLLATDPLLGLLRALPPSSPQVRGADEIVAAGRDLVEAGRAGLRVAGRYVDIREAHAANPTERSAMAGLVELVATSTADTSSAAAAIERARTQLAELPGGLIGPLADARDLLVQRIDQYAPVLQAYVDAQDVLPAILGWETPRRYLVLAMDPAELRASGGFGGTYGLVTFDRGRITERAFRNTLSLDLRPGWESAPYVEPPPGLKGHLLGNYPWQLADAAWSPDFPTSARDALRLYTLESGDTRVDGVIALTTYAVDRLLEVTGPIAVPEYGTSVPPGETTLRALQNTRVDPRPGVDRKVFLDIFAGKLVDTLLALPPRQWPQVLDRLGIIGRERQASAWFVDPAAEQLIAANGWDGSVRQDAGDYLFAVDSNVAPVSKYNFLTQRSQSLDVRIDAVGNATNTLDLSWLNAYDTPAGDPIRALPWTGSSTNGMLGNYVRVLVPDRSRLESVSGGGSAQLTVPEDVSDSAGRTSFANFLLIPPGTTRLAYRWVSPYAADADRGGGLYRLTVQKQPGTVADPFELRVSVPDGAVITEASAGLIVSGRTATLSTTLREDFQVSLRYRFGGS